MEKILVIDDEQPTLKMFSLFLDAFGYDVVTAESGEQGLDAFRTHRPGIVLTDIKMPGMDGIEVLRRIKAMDPGTEVIVITGHGDMELAMKALHLDAADFINKPLGRKALEDGLRRAKERMEVSRSSRRSVVLRKVKEVPVVRIKGNLNTHSEPYLRDACAAAAGEREDVLVLDFEDNASINGAGIAALTGIVTDVRDRGGKVYVVGLSENFKKVFDTVELSPMVEMYPTMAEVPDLPGGS
ncbi:MAG TPA: response regulator [Desulfomicrobiaceae bacterium]|jgi:anti-anti-sigma factor|nr:response regulator [Desulfomicrobiaceae bacterium]